MEREEKRRIKGFKKNENGKRRKRRLTRRRRRRREEKRKQRISREERERSEQNGTCGEEKKKREREIFVSDLLLLILFSPLRDFIRTISARVCTKCLITSNSFGAKSTRTSSQSSIRDTLSDTENAKCEKKRN